jgi:hypothetical protein
MQPNQVEREPREVIYTQWFTTRLLGASAALYGKFYVAVMFSAWWNDTGTTALFSPMLSAIRRVESARDGHVA